MSAGRVVWNRYICAYEDEQSHIVLMGDVTLISLKDFLQVRAQLLLCQVVVVLCSVERWWMFVAHIQPLLSSLSTVACLIISATGILPQKSFQTRLRKEGVHCCMNGGYTPTLTSYTCRS